MRWGIQVCFLAELGDQQVAPSSKIGAHPGTPIMSRFCLCWRCTRAGMLSDPDVVLLRWAFWVQGDLILIYYWGGLRSAAPMGSGPCSAVLRHLRVANALVCMQLSDWAGDAVTRPKRFNLGIREFGAVLMGSDLVRRTKTRD